MEWVNLSYTFIFLNTGCKKGLHSQMQIRKSLIKMYYIHFKVHSFGPIKNEVSVSQGWSFRNIHDGFQLSGQKTEDLRTGRRSGISADKSEVHSWMAVTSEVRQRVDWRVHSSDWSKPCTLQEAGGWVVVGKNHTDHPLCQSSGMVWL